jgi:hypothetical protein
VSDQDHTTVEAQSPADVALAYRARIKTKLTLNEAESRVYRTAVRTMRRVEGRERKWIADLLGISPGAVDRLLRAPKTMEATS